MIVTAKVNCTNLARKATISYVFSNHPTPAILIMYFIMLEKDALRRKFHPKTNIIQGQTSLAGDFYRRRINGPLCKSEDSGHGMASRRAMMHNSRKYFRAVTMRFFSLQRCLSELRLSTVSNSIPSNRITLFLKERLRVRPV
jgi:hypothetical protein